MSAISENLFNTFQDCRFNHHVGFVALGILQDTADPDSESGYNRYHKYWEGYALRVARALSNLSDLFDKINHARIAMKNFPNGEELRRHGITENDHIRYHVEVFCVRTRSVEDLSLHLVNQTFDLGLPERDVNARLVKEMRQVSGTNTEDALNSLKGVTNEYGGERNNIVHARSHQGERLQDIEMIAAAKSLTTKYDSLDNDHLSDINLDGVNSGFVLEKDLEFRNTLEDLDNAIGKLCDTLWERYQSEIPNLPLAKAEKKVREMKAEEKGATGSGDN